MTKTRFTLDDAGAALSWVSLLHFIQHLGIDSALYKKTTDNQDMIPWLDGSLTTALLADLIDVINMLRYEHAKINSKKAPPPVKPVKRPWVTKTNERIIGQDPIPIKEFDTWWSEGSVTNG